MERFDHPYAKFLHRVVKPTRYTGSEHGARPKDWASVEARICLAFPEIYDIGMSHLGFRMLYKILNDDPRTLAERAYAPWVDMQEELRKNGKLLVALESQRPLCDFDVVGFSLQYELTYTNILGMLELSGIPLRSANRSDEDPLVLAGGPVATHAEPMAPFLDAILIGDGEEAATEIALGWARDRRAGIPRAERLARLSKVRGVYVPSLYETALDPASKLEFVARAIHPDAPLPVERRLLADISRFPFPDDGPVGGPEAIFDRMSIEVARGCTEGCRFCQAGMIYRPVRERDPEEVIATVLSALDKSGQDQVSLTALSTADVSCISPLIKRLVEKTAPERVSLSVASLRAYGLAEDLLDDMRKVRAAGLTFAPEAGTQRMRNVINKNVTEEQLLETAERSFSRGFDKMKLYFILGLPTETDEDVLGIVDVGRNALAVGKRLKKNPRVTVSVSTHIPKPHTPFQWCAMDTFPEIERKQAMLRDAARRVRGLNLKTHDATASVLEGILARGDRRLANVIERAFLRGARFDSWDEQLKLEVWQEAFEHFEIDTEVFLRTLPIGGRLPWDHLDIGLEDGFLAREYRRAVSGRASPPCGKVAGMFVHHTNAEAAEADARRLVCYDCGIACDLGKMREERLVFLRRLGAERPNPPRIAPPEPAPNGELAAPNGEVAAPNGEVAAPNGEVAAPNGELAAPNGELAAAEPAPVRAKRKPRVRPESLRPKREGGPPVGVRIRFAKVGPAALLGHLDLARELSRTLRRAMLRVRYSEGFHPKPDLSFAPALSLGVASLDEYVDVRLIDPPPAAEILARLERAAASGLRFLDVVPLAPGDPAVSTVVTGARYVVALALSELRELGGTSGLESLVARFLERSELRLRRDVGGVGKMVDVRSYVRELRVGDERSVEALREAGIVGEVVALDMTLVITQNGSAKVAEVVQALTEREGFPHLAVRAKLIADGSTPLDVARFRKPKPAAAVPVDLVFS